MNHKLAQNLILIIQKTRIILLPYKRNYLLRAFVVLLVTVTLWFLTNGGLKEGIAYPFIVLWMELMTINIFFERDFIPSDNAIADFFGSKSSCGYILFCLFYFILYWGLFFWMVFIY
jgi:hypothetical protein